MPGPGTKFESYPIFFILLKQSKKPLWNRRTLRVAMEIEQKKCSTTRAVWRHVSPVKVVYVNWKKKIKIKKKRKRVTYHNRIEFVIVAIHPIGGHGFSVFDANFGEFISGDGWQNHQLHNCLDQKVPTGDELAPAPSFSSENFFFRPKNLQRQKPANWKKWPQKSWNRNFTE